MAWWCGGKVPDLRSVGRGFESQLPCCRVQPWEVVNTHVPVTKQYNLVPANGWWCLAAGKVTVGLASHWPCVTDISGSPPTGSRPGRGRWALPYAVLWSMVDFTFTFITCKSLVAFWCASGQTLLLCSRSPTLHYGHIRAFEQGSASVNKGICDCSILNNMALLVMCC